MADGPEKHLQYHLQKGGRSNGNHAKEKPDMVTTEYIPKVLAWVLASVSGHQRLSDPKLPEISPVGPRPQKTGG